MVAILQKELDPTFKYDVANVPGGEYLKRCFSCGVCSAGCLIGEVTPEFDPRKLIRMVLLGMRAKVLSSPSVWLCLLCHNCSFHCPQDVRISDVIAALRFLAVKEKYLPASFVRKIGFQSVLPSHTRMELFTRPLTVYQALGLPSLIRRPAVRKRLSQRLGDLEYMVPPVPLRPLRRILKEVTPARGEKKLRVGFFLGCADDLVFASAGTTTVSMLSRNGCEVVIPRRMECCGMPCVGYGEMDQALKLAKRNIDAFEAAEVEYIISDCGTCGSFLKTYSDLLKGDPQYAERASNFSRKIADICQFLIGEIGLKPGTVSLEGKVTYHDSCHLRWMQKVSAQPRKALGLIPGLELVEMKESDTCCGGAGSYNLTHYQTSMSILDRKMANIAATNASLIATGCPGCRIQLRLGVKRRGLEASVVHPVELLEQSCQK